MGDGCSWRCAEVDVPSSLHSNMAGVGILPDLAKAPGMNGRESFLGTDVGGTFTDLALITESGELHCFKVPSTPSQPGASILSGVEEIETTVAFEGTAWRRSLHTQRRKGADNPRT